MPPSSGRNLQLIADDLTDLMRQQQAMHQRFTLARFDGTPALTLIAQQQIELAGMLIKLGGMVLAAAQMQEPPP